MFGGNTTLSLSYIISAYNNDQEESFRKNSWKRENDDKKYFLLFPQCVTYYNI